MSIRKIPNSFRYSEKLLTEYSRTSLENAQDLIEEAELLLKQGKLARAYFIAIAAIEETGKSFIAYDAQGRNLNDSAVTAKIRYSLESHSKKISSAFLASVISHSDIKNDVMTFVDIMIALKNGREPSMYTDINYSTGEIQTPVRVVSPRAANDCVQLAKHCYYKNTEHQKTQPPTVRSQSEDHFYGMKDGKVNQLFKTEDFWWFHIARMEAGNQDVSESILVYQREYLSKGKRFKPEEAE
ncbi:AbiV family abortive infection protein [Salinimonas chungwhensis]|uniref:AbiV family abortive infection protein n=1 Tax=Salinimonas chungwhensis TaxID=265425 RepID=UPI00037FBE54|nr:AbiV family abortive infection protein [Salinimonas chungwhensis]